jgi:capsular polysaccharide biosynthesis protein
MSRGFVGIHGAGLMNALLARTGARMIEIRPAGGCWRMVELLARIAGLTWQGVSCEGDPHQPGASLIPIEQVLEMIS